LLSCCAQFLFQGNESFGLYPSSRILWPCSSLKRQTYLDYYPWILNYQHISIQLLHFYLSSSYIVLAHRYIFSKSSHQSSYSKHEGFASCYRGLFSACIPYLVFLSLYIHVVDQYRFVLQEIHLKMLISYLIGKSSIYFMQLVRLII